MPRKPTTKKPVPNAQPWTAAETLYTVKDTTEANGEPECCWITPDGVMNDDGCEESLEVAVYKLVGFFRLERKTEITETPLET